MGSKKNRRNGEQKSAKDDSRSEALGAGGARASASGAPSEEDERSLAEAREDEPFILGVSEPPISPFQAIRSMTGKTCLSLMEILVQSHKIDVRQIDKDGYGLLHTSVVQGNSLTLCYLLKCKAPVNQLNADLNTPLHLACTYIDPLNTSMAQILMSARADLTARNKIGCTPLLMTSSYSNLGILNAIMAKNPGIDINDKDGDDGINALHMTPDVDFARRLVELKADVNVRTLQKELTAVHLCVILVYGAKLRFLLEARAEVNTVSTSGLSPLHSACEKSEHPEFVSLLLEYRASQEVRADSTRSCFHVAAQHKNNEAAVELLRAGARMQCRMTKCRVCSCMLRSAAKALKDDELDCLPRELQQTESQLRQEKARQAAACREREEELEACRREAEEAEPITAVDVAREIALLKKELGAWRCAT